MMLVGGFGCKESMMADCLAAPLRAHMSSYPMLIESANAVPMLSVWPSPEVLRPDIPFSTDWKAVCIGPQQSPSPPKGAGKASDSLSAGDPTAEALQWLDQASREVSHVFCRHQEGR